MNKSIAVIFDRDGIIINSEFAHLTSIAKALEKQGIIIDKADRKQIVGRNPEDYRTHFTKKYDFFFEKFKKVQRDLYYKLLESAEYFTETIDLINDLYGSKIPLAVTTSAGRQGTIMILEKVKILDKFNVIVTKEDCSKRKPHPEPYLLTAKKLKMDPKLCVVFEDTALGVESAKGAGMQCVAIPNEITKGQDFSKADFVIESAREINLDILINLINKKQ